MVLRRIHRMLKLQLARHLHLPQGPTGQAIGYALGQWEGLQVYLDHGEIEIDNNGIENAIRPTAIGKKNYLFFGSGEAGKQSAAIYSIVGTCRILGINLRDYLNDVLTRLPGLTSLQVEELTPGNWQAARRKDAKSAA